MTESAPGAPIPPEPQSLEEIQEATGVDPWFLENIRELVDFESELKNALLTPELLERAKKRGYSDAQIARAGGTTPDAVAALRAAYGLPQQAVGIEHALVGVVAEHTVESPAFLELL